jgi:hypothetical protein
VAQLPVAQVAQPPHEALPQHAPPTQLLDVHCSLTVQAVPFVCCGLHDPPAAQ